MATTGRSAGPAGGGPLGPGADAAGRSGAERGGEPLSAADPVVVRVVPDVPALRRRFDYLLPASQAATVAVGAEVRVVLHGRRVRAWISEIGVRPPDGVTLRPVTAVRGIGPPAPVVALAAWAAWRWAGTVPTFLRTASAATVVRALPGGPSRLPSRPAAAAVPAGGGGGTSASGVDAAAALCGGTAVVRLGPATDPSDLIAAAARRLRPGSGGVLVVVPEVRQVRAVVAGLRRQSFPVAELPGDWAMARRGGCVAVGTRAAAWAPLPALDAAVVLDAHDQALVEQRAPSWSAWAVVAERARLQGAPCVLVSACPTLDLLAAGRLVRADRTAERRGWPPVEVVDRRDGDPRHGLLSPRLADLVRWAASSGESVGAAGTGGTGLPTRRVVCVINRTGGARLVACAACGELARCVQCHGALELVDGPAPALACRRCGSSRPVVCGRCGSTATRALRPGVSRLRRDLQALAGAPVAEVTGATGEDAGDPASGASVVVGTDAALRRIGAADAVVLLDFDAELLAPRLRAAEEAIALLARAARLVRRSALTAPAGRAPGRLVVQTRQPGHPVVRAAVAGDPGLVAESELPVRQALRLPPVTAVAQVSGAGAAAYAAALADVAPPGLEVDGPYEGMWTVRAPGTEALCDTLASVPRPAERLRVEVDPLRM